MQSKSYFNLLVSAIRRQKKISRQALCEGLCTFQEISYLESGSRNLDRLLQDELLDRLGIGTENYEHFLNCRDYDRWRSRQRILHAITFGQSDTAKQRLQEYHENYCRNTENCPSAARNKLEMQFYLSMLAQILRCQGRPDEELHPLFHQALSLTVPLYGQKPLRKLVLSLKELNLMLEAEHSRPEGERCEIYFNIVSYIESRQPDQLGMAKIYPKAVYFLCRCALKTAGGKNCHETNSRKSLCGSLLQYCSRAVQVLLDAKRMYFLWELTKTRGILLSRLARAGALAGDLKALQQENLQCSLTLQKKYRRFGIPEKTLDFCFLYIRNGIHCINDVIRIRRNMLEIRPEELCRGICSTKTLKRLEERRTAPQLAVVKPLFERLGLSGELIRAELVTSDPKALEIMAQLQNNNYSQQAVPAARLLDKAKALAPAEIKQNQQTLLRHMLLFRWSKKEISTAEYLEQLLQALELTLPYAAFLKDGEKFLTAGEYLCIQSRIKALEPANQETLVCMCRFKELYTSYTENELQENASGTCEFILCSTGFDQESGEKEDIACQQGQRILEECLRFRRFITLETGPFPTISSFNNSVR